MSAAPRRAIIVSHTHWDREWYQTFHEFRLRFHEIFFDLIDELETGGVFRHFLLDGQLLILEDFLEVFPEEETRIVNLVKEGKLSLGPWYLLPDEFLVSGEATLRNLAFGHALGGRLGGVQKVGYMPDSFGHLAQMPQILRGAGIDSFIYTRGNGDEIERTGLEYIWRGPDGSTVLALNQCEGYCNAGGLGHEEIWHAHTPRQVRPSHAVGRIRELFEKTAVRSNCDCFLISNGCDHFPAQRDFKEVLQALKQAFPETEFSHGPLGDYVAAVRESDCAVEVHEGELLGAALHFVLSGVWSARVNLKQINDEMQELLTGLVEPFAAYARFHHAQPWPGKELRYAWKKLLENHPHDSICGCSTDEVHSEMLTRFNAVRQSGEGLLQRGFRRLAPEFAPGAAGDHETAIAVFNPLPERRNAVVERMLILQPHDCDWQRLRVVDEEGKAVPQACIFSEEVERFWAVDYRNLPTCRDQLEKFAVYRDKFGDRILGPAADGTERDHYMHIVFEAADLPALGHRNFYLREADDAPPPADAITQGENFLENRYLRATLGDDGLVAILDKATGRSFEGLCLLSDLADAGDEYDFAALGDAPRISSSLKWVREAGTASDLRGSLTARSVMRLPRRLTPDRRSRSSERANCALALTLTLTSDSRHIDLEIEIDNRAEDHRLQIDFPLPFSADKLWSEGAFLVHDRPVPRASPDAWHQKELKTWPQQGFSLMEDSAGGLAVFAKGLHEVEGRKGGFAVTLLRSVGWLSRDDFSERGHANAGPTLPTPDAQMPGRHRFHLALMPFGGHWLDADVHGESLRWRRPARLRQGVVDGLAQGGELFRKSNPRVAFSALRVHEARDTLILRLFNLDGEAQVESLEFGLPVINAWRCDLLEERGEAIAVGDRLELALDPHELVCLELQCG